MQIQPGQYQMRNGECATVLLKNPVEDAKRCWIGVDSYGDPMAWFADGRRFPACTTDSDLIAPWPAPVVRDLIVLECVNGFGLCCVGVGHTQDAPARFRLTWHPAQPDVLGWERVK